MVQRQDPHYKHVELIFELELQLLIISTASTSCLPWSTTPYYHQIVSSSSLPSPLLLLISSFWLLSLFSSESPSSWLQSLVSSPVFQPPSSASPFCILNFPASALLQKPSMTSPMCRAHKEGTTVSCLDNARTKQMEVPWVWFDLISKSQVEMAGDAQYVSTCSLIGAHTEYRHIPKEDSHHNTQGHQSIGRSSMYNIPVK